MWKRIANEEEPPEATQADRSWKEIVPAAAFQGAVFGAVKAGVDRGGLKGFERLTGVWAGDRKIGSIGVHVSRRVTTHGFAINVDNDLEPFSWVLACGLPDVTMTSLAHELAPEHATGMPCVRRRTAFEFCRAHGRRQRLVSPRRLGIDAPLAAPAGAAVRVAGSREALPA